MKRVLSLLSVIVVLALALSALAITSSGASLVKALGLTVPQAVSPASEAVTKTGVAGTVPDGGVGSQTIEWTIDYDLTSADPLTNLTLTDTWSAGQTLVPGSVHTPGGTWSFSQPDSTSITFTNALVAPNGQGSGISLPIPLSGPINFSGAGDGFNPTITDNGKILGFNHHTSNTGIWCYDMTANATCPGYKMYPGIDSSNDAIARAIGNKIYLATSAGGSGYTAQAGYIYCWDSNSDSTCGQSQYLAGFDQLEVISGKLYTLLTTGEIDCYDPAFALAECAGYPVQINVPATSYDGTYNGNSLLSVGNDLYALNVAGLLNCINVTTQGFCSGWSSTALVGQTGEGTLFPRLNAGGAITGICQIGSATAADCYDLDGTNAVNLPAMSVLTSGGPGQYFGFADDSTYLGSRVYLAGFQNGITCWDWSTNAVCTGAGFDVNGRVTDTGVTSSYPYGVTHDTGCLYTFGDGGSLYSIDPTSGVSPCPLSTGQATVNIDDFYGATTPGSVSATWNTVSLTDVNLTPGVEFTSLIVTVVNPDDNSVVAGPSEMIGSAGQIDLSGVSSSTRTLTLQVVAQPVGTTAWADTISPKIWLSFNSNVPVQFTYQTTVTCAGSVQSLSNTVNTTLDPHTDTANVSACADITPTPTVTGTATDIVATSTATKTATRTPTHVITATTTPTATNAITATRTKTPTRTATATATGTATPITITVYASAPEDGWVLESSETSGVGGTMQNTGAIQVGDDAAKKQYRGVLSFDTSVIPDTATIIGLVLKIKQQGIFGGGDPYTSFNGCLFDIKNGFFGTSSNLEVGDFQSAANGTYGPSVIPPNLVSSVYSFNLIVGAANINKLTSNGGLTQVRMRFVLDDNNDAVANFLNLYSGNAATTADRPQLVITYTP